MSKGIAVDVRVNQSLTLVTGSGERVRIALEEKSGRLARLRITAPDSVAISPPEKK